MYGFLNLLYMYDIPDENTNNSAPLIDYKCEGCQNEWQSRIQPDTCPACHSPKNYITKFHSFL